MAIADQNPYVSYDISAGGVTEFTFPFCLFEVDDLVVEVDGVAVTEGFTITGIGERSGGQIAFDVEPSGDVLVIKLAITYERDTDYQDNGDLLAASLNNDFDKVWQALRWMYQNYLVAIKLPLETEAAQEITETAAERAGGLIGFDANGDVAVYAGQVDLTEGGDPVNVAQWGADFLGAASITDAKALLEIDEDRQAQAGVRYTTAGTAPDYTLTPSPAIVAYATGQRFTAVIHSSADTGPTAHTLAVSGLAAKDLKSYDHTGAKVDTLLAADQIAVLEYDGTDFVILNPLPSSPITGTAGSYVGYDTNGNITEAPGPVFNAKFTSASYAIENSTAYASIAHGLGVVPDMVIMKLKCVNVSGSGGYALGDILDVMSMGNTGDKYCCDYDDTDITIKVIDPVSTGNIKVRAKGGGASSQTNVPKTDWEILVVCYAFVTPGGA